MRAPYWYINCPPQSKARLFLSYLFSETQLQFLSHHHLGSFLTTCEPKPHLISDPLNIFHIHQTNCGIASFNRPQTPRKKCTMPIERTLQAHDILEFIVSKEALQKYSELWLQSSYALTLHIFKATLSAIIVLSLYVCIESGWKPIHMLHGGHIPRSTTLSHFLLNP